MSHQRARIAKLERRETGKQTACVCLFANEGETTSECIQRHGYDPKDPAKHFIVVSWAPPDDACL